MKSSIGSQSSYSSVVYTAGCGSSGQLGQGQPVDSAAFAICKAPHTTHWIAAGSYNTVTLNHPRHSNKSADDDETKKGGNLMTFNLSGLLKCPKDGSTLSNGTDQDGESPESLSSQNASPADGTTNTTGTAASENSADGKTADPGTPKSPSTPTTPAAAAAAATAASPAKSKRPVFPECGFTASPWEVLFELSNPEKIKQITLGNYHALALTESGHVYSWGSSRYGQLGIGGTGYSNKPELVVKMPPARAIACGTTYSAAVSIWGELYMWGDNSSHQLGQSDMTSRSFPTPVSLPKGSFVNCISCGPNHAACLTEAHELFMWGRSSKEGEECVTPTLIDTSSIVQPPVCISKIACGGWHTVFVMNTGQLYEWPLGEDFSLLSSQQSFRDVACGNFHSVVLTDYGVVYSWGGNTCHQLGRPKVKSKNPLPDIVSGIPCSSVPMGNGLKVAAGEFHTVVLCDNGTRFAAVKKFVAMLRGYFRQLLLLTRGYIYPILDEMAAKAQVVAPAPVQQTTTSHLRKSVSFFIKGGMSFNSSQDQTPSDVSAQLSRSSGTACPPTPDSKQDGRRLSTFLSSRTSNPTPSSPHRVNPSSNTTVDSTASMIIPMQRKSTEWFKPEELQAVFGGVEDLCFCIAEFLELLDNKLNSWSPQQTLSDVFSNPSIISCMRKHIDFCDGFVAGQKVLNEARRRSGELSAFLKDCAIRTKKVTSLYGFASMVTGCSSDEECDLDGLLMKPAHFVARLQESVMEMEAATDSKYAEKKKMKLVLESVNHFVQRVNQNFHLNDYKEILRCAPDEFGNPQLMGDTLEGLVSKLLHDNISDPKFQEVFFMTYRSFCTPQRFLLQVVTHFKTLQKEQGHVRRKVFSIISAWVSTCWKDLVENNNKVLKALIVFLSGEWIDDESKPFADNVKRILEANVKRPMKGPQLPEHRKCQKSIDLKKDPVALLEFARKDLAHCLSVQDYMMFAAIEPEELFDKKWDKSDAKKLCPNMMRCIQRSNALTKWTGKVIDVIGDTSVAPKEKSSLVNRLVELCQELLNRHDMLAFVAIMPGLSMISEKDVPRECAPRIHEWEELIKPMHNYSRYREFMQNTDPPSIPLLGVTLKDLTFVVDGNPDFLYGTKDSEHPIINFYKRRKLAEIINDLVRYQQIPFVEVQGQITPVLWNACVDIDSL